MRLLRIVSDVQRLARRVQRGLEVNDITGLQLRGIAIEREDGEAGKAGMDL